MSGALGSSPLGSHALGGYVVEQEEPDRFLAMGDDRTPTGTSGAQPSHTPHAITFTAVKSGDAESITLDTITVDSKCLVAVFDSSNNLLSSGETLSTVDGLNVIGISPSVKIVEGETYKLAYISTKWLELRSQTTKSQWERGSNSGYNSGMPNPFVAASTPSLNEPRIWLTGTRIGEAALNTKLPKLYSPNFRNPSQKPLCDVEAVDSNVVMFLSSHKGAIRDLSKNQLSIESNGDVHPAHNGVQFDGDQDYLRVESEKFLLTEWAVIATVASNSAAASEIISSNDYNIKLRIQSGLFKAEVKTTTSQWKSITTSTAITLGKKYRVGATLRGTELALFVDGKLEGSVDIGAAPLTSNHVVLGVHSSLAANEFGGIIDDVEVIGRGLSDAAMVDRLYHPYRDLQPKSQPSYQVGTAVSGSAFGIVNIDGDDSIIDSQVAIISGTLFGNDQGKVFIGDVEQTITNWTDTAITITVNQGALSTGAHTLKVHKPKLT